MKKIIFLILAILAISVFALIIRLTAGGSEDTWLCQDGQWVKHGNPASAQPVGNCQKSAPDAGGLLGAFKKAKELNNLSYTLDLSGQNLKSLTAELFNDNTQTQTLDVSHNQLTGALPAEIRKMANLRILKADHNKLTGIPAEIGQLKNLTEIDFSDNQLDTMPNEIENIKDNLKVLNLKGNRYSAQSLSVIKAKLPLTQVITE